MIEVTVETFKRRQVIDITSQIEEELERINSKEGVVNLFVKHTTCALTTADLDPGTDQDMLNAFDKLIPKLNYTHPHDPNHVEDHILSALIGTCVNVPFVENKLQLGTWQRVVLFEFNGPKVRTLLLYLT